MARTFLSNLSVDSDFPYVSYIPLVSYVPIKFITLCHTCNTTPTPCYSVTLLQVLRCDISTANTWAEKCRKEAIYLDHFQTLYNTLKAYYDCAMR